MVLKTLIGKKIGDKVAYRRKIGHIVSKRRFLKRRKDWKTSKRFSVLF